jgi:hypothetical protein
MIHHLSLKPSGSELASGLAGLQDNGIIGDRIELHIFPWMTRQAMSQRHMAGLAPTVLERNANALFQRRAASVQGKVLKLGW